MSLELCQKLCQKMRFYLILLFLHECHAQFNIGAVLGSNAQIQQFNEVIRSISSLSAETILINSNPIVTAQNVCTKLITKQVYAVIVSGDASPASVSFTCGFYNIPVIGLRHRDSSLSDKNLHGSFLRTIAPYSHQADVWTQILQRLHYQSVVFIHSSDSDGRTTLGRFEDLADAANIKIETIIEYEPGVSDVARELHAAKHAPCRVFILYANTNDAVNIFEEVKRLQMDAHGFVWLVSEQALHAHNKLNGVLALRLNASDEYAMIHDTVSVLSRALTQFNDNTTMPPSDCARVSKWNSGLALLELLKKQSFDGRTGRVAFDEFGDRLMSDYHVVNVVEGREQIVGSYTFNTQLHVQIQNIVWPGNARDKPTGYVVPTHLRAVTIPEKPFVWAKEARECSDKEIECFNGTRRFCCSGYCMDLLRELSVRLNFTFALTLVEDGQYGSFDFADGYDKGKRWTGMVAGLVSKLDDLIVAPLTINPERSQVIDFSKPFKYEGITILQKKQPRKATLASFLQPFHNKLWLLVLVSVHVVALALYLLDRFSPFGGFHADTTEALNLSSAIWFSWGVLLNSGIGERTPRSFSARVLGMVWAGFAMIVVASYTANLAAFLVLNPRDDTTISGIEDSRLRNPVDSFTFATVKGSSVDMFFQRQVELANAYRTMEETNRASAEDAIQALKSGELDAFIWDSPRLEYEASHDCELVTAGEAFARSGYGIGLQKNSLWTEKVTLALLGMHESGFMETLDNKWIIATDKQCVSEQFLNTLTMKNLAGVFILVCCGIVIAFGLIIVEIIYKKRRARKLRRIAIAKQLAIKWRMRVQRKRGMKKSILRAPFSIDYIPPPPPPPVLRNTKRSAQQKIYEFKHR